MPYSDSNPERRNLIVLSLAIIIYYIGGGEISEQTINLPLINIVFNNKDILTAFVWLMLHWFLFRYIVTNRSSYGRSLDEHRAYTNMEYPIVKSYMDAHLGANKNLRQVSIFKDINNFWKARIGSDEVRLNKLQGYLIIKLYLLKVLFKHRATTDYYIPYFLFLIALLFGIYNLYLITPNFILYTKNTILGLLSLVLLYLSVK